VVVLHLLLPLQVLTGVMIWGAARYPVTFGPFLDLRVLFLLHTAGAWAFVLFIIVHVYMTTTGYHPFSNIKAMFLGYEVEERLEVEAEAEGSRQPELNGQEVHEHAH